MPVENKESDSCERLQDMIRRVYDAQIALTEGMTKCTIDGSKEVIRSSSDAVSTGLEGLLNGWSQVIKGGSNAMSNGINGLIDGSSTAVKCFQKTLEDVADILSEKTPSERKPDPVKQSRDRMSALKKADPEVLIAKGEKAGISRDKSEPKITRAKKRRN